MVKNTQKKKIASVPRSFSAMEETPFDIVMVAIQKLTNERMQRVLVERFGLDSQSPKTLENIGRRLAITRERVRQIENEALKKIEKNKGVSEVAVLIDRLYGLLGKYEGIASELRIMNEFRNNDLSEADKRALVMVLRMAREVNFLNRPQEYEKAWYLKGSKIDLVHELRNWLTSELTKEARTMTDEEVISLLNQNKVLESVPNHVLHSYIDIPKHVQKNIFGKWGLVHWPEVRPKTVRDKIYLVFKKAGKPMHFRDIAKDVNSLGVGRKKACAPTVHNELIKDPRFVLIGRGIYALREWKYQPGTVSEILVRILKKNNRPMKKDELIEEVLKQRQVQPNTVVLNLQNSKLFKKDKQGGYSLSTRST